MKHVSFRRKALLLATLVLLLAGTAPAQIASRMQTAMRQFLADEQLSYAVVGFYLADAQGQLLYQHQGNYGLAPASSLKVLTAATALDVLGSQYRFSTQVGYRGTLANGILQGDMVLKGGGDPTLCSWRYPSVPDTAFFEAVYRQLQAKGIGQIQGNLASINLRYSPQAIPGGWIYADMGNYYGAGIWSLNYRENQYDARLDTRGPVGSPAPLRGTQPEAGFDHIYNQVTVGDAGSGDNSIIYAAPYSQQAYISGSLGRGQAGFSISGSVPDGEKALLTALRSYLQQRGITIRGQVQPASHFQFSSATPPAMQQELLNWPSVTLDSVVYWFLQKSVNAYGEALLKKLAYEQKNWGDTETGVEWMRNYWAARGIDRHALHLQDGSGLSPQNRITPKALVQVLHYARSKPWFSAFYDGLPLIHQYKMKSGTIGGAKAYAGYIADARGRQYTFALLVNNYSGSASSVVQKMWTLLDQVGQYKGE